MSSYWCTFKKHKAGTVTYDYRKYENLDRAGPGQYIPWDKMEARVKQQAKEITGEDPLTVDQLPYPASPQLNVSGMPSFCYKPTECKGRSSCPQRISCCD